MPRFVDVKYVFEICNWHETSKAQMHKEQTSGHGAPAVNVAGWLELSSLLHLLCLTPPAEHPEKPQPALSVEWSGSVSAAFQRLQH